MNQSRIIGDYEISKNTPCLIVVIRPGKHTGKSKQKENLRKDISFQKIFK